MGDEHLHCSITRFSHLLAGSTKLPPLIDWHSRRYNFSLDWSSDLALVSAAAAKDSQWGNADFREPCVVWDAA